MPPQWLMPLKLLSAAFGYLLIALLIRRGMGRPYAAFLSLIFLQATSWAVGDRFPFDFQISAYVGVTIASWVLYTYVVCEMFGRVFTSYPGIVRTGRKVIGISMLIALTVSILTAEQEFGNVVRATGILIATVGERVVSAAIVVYLTLILGFLRWMPVPLPVNTTRHTVIFFFYFIANSLVFHYWNRVARAGDLAAVNATLAIGSCICFGAWTWLLRPEGERVAPLLRPATPDSERILRHLAAINRALDRGIAGH